MSAIIMIEIVVGLVVLVAAVRFAVRDARERRAFGVDQDVEPTAPAAAATPKRAAEPEQQPAEPEAPQQLSGVGGAETN